MVIVILSNSNITIELMFMGVNMFLARLRLRLTSEGIGKRSSIVGDELTKPTRRLILLQMFTKQIRQNTTEKYFRK